MLRPIVIAPTLARELAVLMRHLGRTEAVVDQIAIDAVASYRHVTIPDDVLAYLAASGESLQNLVDHDEALEAFFRANGVLGWKARAGFAHVSFTAWGDWPRFHATFDATGAVSVFALKTASFEPASLSSILRDRWPSVDFDGARDAPCAPAIRSPAPRPERVVVHPRFGRGRVLADEEGKLRIDFGDSGIKTLLAQFVTDAPEGTG